LPAGEEFFVEVGLHPSKLGDLGLAVDHLAVSPAARAAR
jgi:predicted metal-dependent hydrolase